MHHVSFLQKLWGYRPISKTLLIRQTDPNMFWCQFTGTFHSVLKIRKKRNKIELVVADLLHSLKCRPFTWHKKGSYNTLSLFSHLWSLSFSYICCHGFSLADKISHSKMKLGPGKKIDFSRICRYTGVTGSRTDNWWLNWVFVLWGVQNLMPGLGISKQFRIDFGLAMANFSFTNTLWMH